MNAYSGSFSVSAVGTGSYSDCSASFRVDVSIPADSNTMTCTIVNTSYVNGPNMQVELYYKRTTDTAFGNSFYNSGYKSYGTFPCISGGSYSVQYDVDAEDFDLAINLFISNTSTPNGTSYLNVDRISTVWTNINAYTPEDKELLSSYFDLTYKYNGKIVASYSQISNEPSGGSQYQLIGTIMTISNITPAYPYYELDYVEGATADGNGNYVHTMTANSELIAIHSKYKTSMVILNATGGISDIESLSVTYASTYGDLPKPTKDGYTFIGWFTSEEDGEQILSTAIVEITSDQVLYAQWKPNTYAITFDGNGGTIVKDTLNVVYETDQNCNIGQYKPFRNGYWFLGWYTYPTEGIQIYDSNGLCTNDGTYWSNNVCVYSGDYIVYAQWKPLNIAYFKLEGEWLLCYVYIKVNGIWFPAVMRMKTSGNYDFEIVILTDENDIILTDENDIDFYIID